MCNGHVGVLFARSDSHYKAVAGADVWDIDRDARGYAGPGPVVAHPPCRGWGRLRGLANPRAGELDLGHFAVAMVRMFGGVLEHPAGSTLWDAAERPRPGERDVFGGWTFAAPQRWWGHRAEKWTWFYIVGCEPARLPSVPLALGEASHVIGSSGRRRDGGRLHKGDAGWRPEVSMREREATPPALCTWLLDLARRCHA